MTDQPLKASQLPQAANIAPTDRLLVLYNAANAEVDSLRTVNLSTVAANLTLSNSAPANSTANGVKGTLRYDSSYLYVCISNNVWTRTPLTSW